MFVSAGHGAYGEWMRCESMYVASQKANEHVLAWSPGHFCVDDYSEGIICFGDEAGFVVESMLKVGSALRVEEAESVDYCRCNKIVPGGHAEVAVEEEEYDEDECH